MRRLDGMPLAIELAAGRLSTFSLTDLRDRLDRSLDLLAGRPSGDTRHRTLRATVEWSYQLLGHDEQRLFRHLSVFVDGVDLDTAEQVAGGLGLADDPGSVLARLVDASMVEPTPCSPTGTRYRMLETLRAFGLDRLAAAGETSAAQPARPWAVGLIGWIGATLITEREPEADAALRRELPNLRAAWRLARDGGSSTTPWRWSRPARGDRLPRPDRDPRLGRGARRRSGARRPPPGRRAGRRGEAAYHRGDYRPPTGSRGPGSSAAPTTPTPWDCVVPLASAALARGEFAEAVDIMVAAAGHATRVRDNLWLAALGAAYGGDSTGRGR